MGLICLGLITFLLIVCSCSCLGGFTSPFDYCKEDGSRICLDCDTPVTCDSRSPNGLFRDSELKCSNLGIPSYGCDNEYVPGSCTTSPRCACSDEDIRRGCKVDPNDFSKLILCGSGRKKEFIECETPENVDTRTCSCINKKQRKPEKSEPVCDYENQDVCMTCTITGTCIRADNGTLFPVPRRSCHPGQLCDNSVAPGKCQARQNIQDPHCLSMSAIPGFTDDFIDDKLRRSPSLRQTGSEVTCRYDEEPICVNCTFVGRCIQIGRVLVPHPIFECRPGYFCDGSSIPGRCQDSNQLPETSLCPATTVGPASYCQRDGYEVCFAEGIIGNCTLTSTGYEVVPAFSCETTEVCNNDIAHGICIDSRLVESGICRPLSSTMLSSARAQSPIQEYGPEKFCHQDGDTVCYNCTAPGRCNYDPRTGMTVEPISICAGQLICDNDISKGICENSAVYPSSGCLSRSKEYDRTVFRKNEENGSFEKVSENGIVIPQLGDSCTSSKSDGGSCSRYLRCSNGRYIYDSCPGSLCFDENTGECQSTEKTPNANVDKGVPCPVCGYIKDHESNSCGSFIKCTDGHEKRLCPGQFCFDEVSCSCIPASFL